MTRRRDGIVAVAPGRRPFRSSTITRRRRRCSAWSLGRAVDMLSVGPNSTAREARRGRLSRQAVTESTRGLGSLSGSHMDREVAGDPPRRHRGGSPAALGSVAESGPGAVGPVVRASLAVVGGSLWQVNVESGLLVSDSQPPNGQIPRMITTTTMTAGITSPISSSWQSRDVGVVDGDAQVTAVGELTDHGHLVAGIEV